jgi:hypothetical protein
MYSHQFDNVSPLALYACYEFIGLKEFSRLAAEGTPPSGIAGYRLLCKVTAMDQWGAWAKFRATDEYKNSKARFFSVRRVIQN